MGQNPAKLQNVVKAGTICLVRSIQIESIPARTGLREVSMNRLSVGDIAPDFSLPDHTGRLVRLSDVNQSQHVLLVFNIGFA
jgi:hypothetical protein